MDTSFETHEPHVANYFTFALYFSEKKSKQLCQFLSDYPFVVTDSNGVPTGESGVVAPQLNMGSLHVRGLSLVVSEEEEEEVIENKEDGVHVGGKEDIDDRKDSVVIEEGPSSFVRRITCSRVDGSTAHLSLRFVDNMGGIVDPALVDCLLQKASVDKDEGREYVIDAIQTFCDENNIRVADHFEPSMAIVASRTHIAEQLAGGPYDGEGSVSGKTAMEMLGFWGFLLPSTYYVESSSSHVLYAATEPSSSRTHTNQRENTASEPADPKRIIFEEPNPFYRPDVVIMKPEVASQRSYSHDLCVVRAKDLVRATDEGPDAVGRLIAGAVEAPEGSNPHSKKEKQGDGVPLFSKETRWVVQECLSLLALPVVYKVYVAGDYLSVMCYDAREFTERVVRAVSDCSSSSDNDDEGGCIARGGNTKDEGEEEKEKGCRPFLLKNGAKGFFKALMSLTERRAFQEESSLNAECINYFAKGTRNYDDLWQTVQFLKRPDHLGVQFFGLDVLVVKGIAGEPDRRYIVDVNYLPSYKNEMPARLFPALLKAMMEAHN